MIVDVVFGAQYGDEGKGKIISYFAMKKYYSAYVRAGVGPNAGHTVFHRGKKYALRQLPSGFLDPDAHLYIGAGVLVNPKVLFEEIENFEIDKKRIHIDYNAGVINERHISIELGSEHAKQIGTTKTGCGPAIEDRAGRRLVLAKDTDELKEFVCDVRRELEKHRRVLVEGSQGFMLSNYHGTYPFVTSKDTSVSAFLADVGIGPKQVSDIIMVMKSYTTRVGNGPLKNELSVEEIKKYNLEEYGTVTGRLRRVSKDLHFDDLEKAVLVNTPTCIALTKLDALFKEIKGIKNFDELKITSKEAYEFVVNIEKRLKVNVKYIGTGPNDDEIIVRDEIP
ncbi:MAG: adenylosuccinate synthetase [Candidatus Micrarchaeota archaeon]|nr:adenylosuccinate synthetase [Candidatus Micrarchaeota archaeon]